MQRIVEKTIEILSSDIQEVDRMVANITRTIEEMKEEAELKRSLSR